MIWGLTISNIWCDSSCRRFLSINAALILRGYNLGYTKLHVFRLIVLC